MSDENLKSTIETTIMIFEFITQYCVPIILCLCLLGNSLSVYVLFRTKLRYNSSSIYLGVLAMSDIGVLLIVSQYCLQKYKIIRNDKWLDVILYSLQMFFCFLSVWTVVAFTIQRYVAIKWPLFRRSLCTVSQVKIMVIRLTGLAVLYSIPWFYVFAKQYNNGNIIRTNLNYWSQIFIIAYYTIILFVLPATMIVAFNVMIAHNICKQNRIRRNLILSSVASNNNTQSSNNEMSHIEVTKMLVIISSIFICLNLPSQVCVLCSLYSIKIENTYFHITLHISIYLFILNYGINFILYCATGENFRRELISLFTNSSNAERDDNGVK